MIEALRIHALVRIPHASGSLSVAQLSMCMRRYAGRLWHFWERQRHGTMPVTLLGTGRKRTKRGAPSKNINPTGTP